MPLIRMRGMVSRRLISDLKSQMYRPDQLSRQSQSSFQYLLQMVALQDLYKPLDLTEDLLEVLYSK